MANMERVVNIIFKGEAAGLRGVVTDINQGLELFERTLDAVLEPLAAVAEGIMDVDEAVAKFAITLGTKALNSFRNYEDACVDLKRLMGDQIDMWEEAEDAVRRMARTYGETMTDVMKTAAEFKRAGFDMERTMKMTEGAIRMLITGNTDLGTATRALIQIFKGYEFEAEKVTEVVDSLIHTSLNYATNVEKLGIGVSEISRIMKDMGYSFQETIGHVIPIIEVFQSGEEAATSLKTAFARLSSGTAPVLRAFDELGISFRDDLGHLKSGKRLMEEFTESLKDLDKVQQQYYINIATGIRQGQKLVLVMGDMEKVTEVTETAQESAGATQDQINQKMDTAARVAKQYAEALNELENTIGAKIDPVVREFTKSWTNLIHVLEGEVRVGTFDALNEALNDTVQRLDKFIQEVANALPRALAEIDWSELTQAWDDLMNTLEDFLGAIDVSKPEELKDVLQLVVDTMASLIKVTEGMLEPLGDLGSDIIDVIEAFNNLSDEEKKSIGNLVMHAKIFQDLGFKVRWAMDVISEMSQDTHTSYKRMSDSAGQWKDAVISFYNTVMLKTKEYGLDRIERMADERGWTDELKAEYDEQLKAVQHYAEASGKSYNDLTGKLERNWTYWEEGLDGVNKKLESQGKNVEISEKTWKAFGDAAKYVAGELDEIPDVKTVKLEDYDTIQELSREAHEVGDYLFVEMPDEKGILITPELKKGELEILDEKLKELQTDKEIEVILIADEAALKDVEEKLKEAAPPKTQVEIILEGMDVLKKQLKEADTGFKDVTGPDGVRDVRLTWQETQRKDLMQQLSDLETQLVGIAKEGEAPDAWEVNILVGKYEEAKETVSSFLETLEEDFPPEKKVDLKVEVNEEALRYAKKRLEDDIPDEIVVDIRLAGTDQFEAETKRFEAETKRASEAIQAQVDITVESIKAEAEMFTSTMENLSSSIDSTASAAADMFESFAEYLTEIDKGAEDADKGLSEMEEQAEELEAAFEDMFDEWGDFVDGIDDALDGIDEMRERLEEIPDVLEDIAERFAEIPDEVEDINKRLEELQKRWDDLHEDERDYAKDKEEQLEKEKEMLDDIFGKITDINELKEKEKELTDEEKEILQEIKELEKERKQLLEEQEELKKERQKALEEQLEIQEDILEKYEEMKQSLEDIGLLTEDWNDKLTVAMGTLDDMAERLDELRERGLIVDAQYEAAKSKLNELANLIRTMPGIDLGDPSTWTESMKKAIQELGFDFQELAKEFGQTYTEGTGLAQSYADELQNMVQQQLDMQRHLINAQVDLAEKQGKLVDARIESIKRGDAVISVDGAGLQPELEAFMWKILETIQIQANAEYSEFLLGLSGMTTVQK